MLKGYVISQRFERIEEKLYDHDRKFELFIQKSLPPLQGIFFDGQIFDAYDFVRAKSLKFLIIYLSTFYDRKRFFLIGKCRFFLKESKTIQQFSCTVPTLHVANKPQIPFPF